MSANFLRYIHNFRGLAILLIVIGHIAAFLDLENHKVIGVLVHVVTVNGSVYFAFIAGFLFQFLSKKYRYKSYLEKKVKNVILPYLLISIPVIYLCLVKNAPFNPTTWFASSFNSWSLLQKIIILYLTGAHFFHFWFMPMIIVFYIFAPAFIWLDQHAGLYKILPLLLALSIVIPRAEDDGLILQNFVHFLSVYILGMFCCHYRDAVLFLMQKYWQGFLLAAIGLIALETALVATNSSLVEMFYINTSSKSILSVVFMYLFWQLDSNFPNKFHMTMGKLADFSFGIYFLHGYIIYIYMLILKYLSLNLWFVKQGFAFLTISSLIVIAINIIALQTVQYLFKKRSRYIIGC